MGTTRRVLGGVLLDLVLFLGWAACGARSLPGSELQDGSVGREVFRRECGDIWDATPCDIDGDKWSLRDAPIQALTVLTSQALDGPVPEGVSVRFRAVISVGGCDEPASLFWNVDSDAHKITLYAFVWAYQGGKVCPDREVLVPLFGEVSWQTRGTWTLSSVYRDLAVDFGMQRCPEGEDCSCRGWEGTPGDIGAHCAYDCHCTYPLTCVFGGRPTIPPQGRCYQTCSSDADCAPGLGLVCQVDVLDRPEGVCVRGDRSCTSDGDCRPGFSCLPTDQDPSLRACQPSMPAHVMSRFCMADCDCPDGYKCSDDPQQGNRCVIPCGGQFDCPGDLCCGLWLDHELYSGPFCTECTDDSTAPAPASNQ